ncbi:MAG: HEAT repeat domain-containing protein [Meiothermus sp.]|nr:HEAT repeat domain-containing protein [Meiothermus sp.]
MSTEILQSLEDALHQPPAPDTGQEELRITSARQLFEAIGSDDMLTKLSVLEAVALDPAGALGLGSDGEADLIAVLCKELEAAYGSELRLFTLAALAAMPADPRVIQKLEQVWFLSSNSNERILAVSRLASEDNPLVRDHLKRTLLGDDPERAQAVAHVWQMRADDSATILRVALAIAQSEGPIPSLQEHPELWLAELHGSFAVQARKVLEANPQTVELLTPCWEKLSCETRAWLLELATRIGSPELPHLTDLALQDEAIQLEAIGAIEAAHASTQYADQLLELTHSPNPVVQAAAVQAGAPGDNRFRAVAAKVRTVRLAAIRRLGPGDLDTLVELLHDPDWRIRSAAADRLAALGEQGMQAVQPLLRHQRLEVRMAAARVIHGNAT